MNNETRSITVVGIQRLNIITGHLNLIGCSYSVSERDPTETCWNVAVPLKFYDEIRRLLTTISREV